MTDESLLETMLLHFVHKVDLCTQVYYAIVINQCKRSVIWTPYNYNNKVVVFSYCFFLFFFLSSFRFKEVCTDSNSTLISCCRFASITVQITFSFKRKAVESMDALRYQRPHSPVLNSLQRCCCASRLQKVSLPFAWATTHLKRYLPSPNTIKRLWLVVILAPWGKAVFVDW